MKAFLQEFKQLDGSYIVLIAALSIGLVCSVIIGIHQALKLIP